MAHRDVDIESKTAGLHRTVPVSDPIRRLWSTPWVILNLSPAMTASFTASSSGDSGHGEQRFMEQSRKYEFEYIGLCSWFEVELR